MAGTGLQRENTDQSVQCHALFLLVASTRLMFMFGKSGCSDHQRVHVLEFLGIPTSDDKIGDLRPKPADKTLSNQLD
jgi:hypothetical protein